MPSDRRSLHASKGQELNSPTPQILRGSLAGWQVPPLGTAEQHREGLGASRASTPYAHIAALVPLPLTLTYAIHIFKYNKILSISDIFLCFSEEFHRFCMHLSDAFEQYKWYIFYNRCCPFLTRCCIFSLQKQKIMNVLKRQKTQTLQRLSLESEQFFGLSLNL